MSKSAKVFLLALGLTLMAGNAWAGSYEIGLKLYAQGNYDLATRYFLQTVQADGANPNAHYYLADSYLKLSRLSDAQAEYQKVLALAPNSQAARFSRIGLVNLHGFAASSWSERWQKVGDSGLAEAVDQYTGPIGDGEDYLDQVTEGGKIVRWSLAKQPLKLYIESSPQGIRNFQPAFGSQAHRALDIWVNALNHQLSYVMVSDPNQADIRVFWTNAIDTRGHSGDGGTAYTAGLMIPHIKDDQIQYMEVKIATFDIKGTPQSSDVVYAVAVHELGHSLGLLGHSEDSNDIMYAQNQHVTSPSKRDIKTIRELYSAKADINNLPASARKSDPKHEAELAKKMDETITRLEAQAKKDGMALTYLNLGVAYFQKAKQVAKATPTTAGATPDAANDPKALYQKSLQAVTQAIQLEPRDPRAYHKRSLVYQELVDYPKALGDIQQAIAFDRKEPEYYMLQSWYLAKLGRVGESRSSLDTYLLYKPTEASSSDVQHIQKELAKKTTPAS
jgi:tetratricopeptide (TPR) repeat protein